jgi:acyl-CoA dehydrogenase
MLYRRLLHRVKRMLPKISETEIIALKSGGVSVDRHLFEGRIDWSMLRGMAPVPALKPMQTRLEALLRDVGKDAVYPADKKEKRHLIHALMRRLGKDGFLSMIIDREAYGGNRLSIEEQSVVLSQLASYNPSLGVAVMVPNSLGPAELLEKYGTGKQKRYFLPRLADGSFVPCFGLTGPNNGSDAVGQIDEALVIRNDNGVIKLRITLNKRYITLAPVANLVGIAFRVKDPDGILPMTDDGKKKEGITVALVEPKNTRGLEQATYHNPNDAGFPNGTLKGTIEIDPGQVIGGADKIGEGWKMLMECLAVGRGVSLPATATVSSKMVTVATMYYIQARCQFNMPIGDMEAVREKFVEMFLHTWIIHCSVKMTNRILDSAHHGGGAPSVLTAIMKQQTTERARRVLEHGMDIMAGSAICTGPNNPFTAFYRASPVGITVEGSNTLTRGLLIFGQGLNKSHPSIFPLYQSILNDDVPAFRRHLHHWIQNIVANVACLVFDITTMEPIDPILRRLECGVLHFSLLASAVATLVGGRLKGKQMLSGAMADILSNLYLAEAVAWYHMHHPDVDIKIRDVCIEKLLDEVEEKHNQVVGELGIPFSYRKTNTGLRKTRFENTNRIYTNVVEDASLHSIWKEDIYYKGTVLEKWETLQLLEPGSPEYERLYQELIQVGEYPVVTP